MFEKSSVGIVRLGKNLEQIGEDIKKSCWFFKENFCWGSDHLGKKRETHGKKLIDLSCCYNYIIWNICVYKFVVCTLLSWENV